MDTSIGEIWQAYHAQLHRFIRQRVGEAAVADALLQEVFLRVVTRIDTLYDQQKLHSWLYQIPRHVISDSYRASQPWHDLPEGLIAPAYEDEAAARQELAQCLLPLIQGLPAASRDALLLAEIAGLTQQQVAAQQGLSLSGAKSRIQRGRGMLRALLVRCCRVAFDHRGTVVAYAPHASCHDTDCAPPYGVRPVASATLSGDDCGQSASTPHRGTSRAQP